MIRSIYAFSCKSELIKQFQMATYNEVFQFGCILRGPGEQIVNEKTSK